TELPARSLAAEGSSATTLALVWYITSISSCFTLAKTRFPSGPGTWFSIANPKRSTQNVRQGSTASTIRTGAMCVSLARLAVVLVVTAMVRSYIGDVGAG